MFRNNNLNKFRPSPYLVDRSRKPCHNVSLWIYSAKTTLNRGVSVKSIFVEKLDRYRITSDFFEGDLGHEYMGAFRIPYKFHPGKSKMTIVSTGPKKNHPPSNDIFNWEHVSVSYPNRCPTWEEMCFVKDIFWGEDETVVQFHPPKKNYVNVAKYCLHLWKPTHIEIPLPPKKCLA